MTPTLVLSLLALGCSLGAVGFALDAARHRRRIDRILRRRAAR